MICNTKAIRGSLYRGPTADEDEVSRLTENHKQIVTDQGGTITKEESWGKRPLAYEILHQTEGNFVLLEIEGSGREIAELERRMRVNDRIIRYLTVRVDEDRRRAEKFKERRARKAAKRSHDAWWPEPRQRDLSFQRRKPET